MIPDQDEIAQVERELEILRSRQASMTRWSRVTKIYLAVTLPIIAALSAALVYTSSSDIVMVAFIFGMVAIIAGLIWIIARQWSVPADQQRPSQFLPYGTDLFWASLNYKSDAESIHDMIVLRKQRLAELKGAPPPSVPSVSGSGRTSKSKRGPWQR
jgi:hypothetical protein